jgi:cellulose synthase operon protein C
MPVMPARLVAPSMARRMQTMLAAGTLAAALCSCTTIGGGGAALPKQTVAVASHADPPAAGAGESGDDAREKARDAFDSKEFLTALHLAPEKYPLLAGLDMPRLAAGEMLAAKSGRPGLDRLDERETVVVGSATHGEDVFGVRTQFLSLFSGEPAGTQLIGSSNLRLFDPTTRLALGLEPTVSWFREGAVQPYVEFGATPSGGVLPPTVEGRAGAVVQFDDNEASGQLYRQPIAESILSYAGIVDPATGRGFGRVTETGAKLAGSYLVTKDFSAEPSITYGVRGGVAVADNPHFIAELELPYAIKVAKFDSFTLGPVYYFEHFDRDENQFTTGNGGYYSPQSYHRIGLQWAFQTAELRDFVVAGWISPGWQWSRENAMLAFPQGDAQLIPRVKESSADFEGQVNAIYRLTPRWSLGGAVYAEQSPQFTQLWALLSLRYSFAPRGALISRDLWLSPVRHF